MHGTTERADAGTSGVLTDSGVRFGPSRLTGVLYVRILALCEPAVVRATRMSGCCAPTVHVKNVAEEHLPSLLEENSIQKSFELGPDSFYRTRR